MTGTIHACIGLAIGRVIRRPLAAFAAGVVSHAVCDMIPHDEAPLNVDMPLCGAAVGGVAAGFGLRSSEVAGLVGAIIPDAEHALVLVERNGPASRLFPTHNLKLPHPDARGFAPQILLALAALAAAEAFRRSRAGSAR